jgi:hypothetical protein
VQELLTAFVGGVRAVVGVQDRGEERGAAAAGRALHQRPELIRRREVLDVRFVHRPGQLARRCGVREVEDRSDRAGDRQVVEGADVLGRDPRGAVNADVVPRSSATADDGHVDGAAGRFEDAVLLERRAVADVRLVAEG